MADDSRYDHEHLTARQSRAQKAKNLCMNPSIDGRVYIFFFVSRVIL